MASRESIDLIRNNLIVYMLRIIKITEKSTYTTNHSDRVAGYANIIGSAMKLPAGDLSSLWRSALLHDIGKLGVDPKIIMAKRKLTKKEYNEVKRHSEIGELILTGRYLSTEAMIARQHHEYFDGSGYPDGLKGKKIHLYARIIAIADVFDSLTDNRPYRTAWPMQDAADYIARNSSKMFDPKIVGIFFELASSGKFEGIQKIEGFKL